MPLTSEQIDPALRRANEKLAAERADKAEAAQRGREVEIYGHSQEVSVVVDAFADMGGGEFKGADQTFEVTGPTGTITLRFVLEKNPDGSNVWGLDVRRPGGRRSLDLAVLGRDHGEYSISALLKGVTQVTQVLNEQEHR